MAGTIATDVHNIVELARRRRKARKEGRRALKEALSPKSPALWPHVAAH